MGAHSRYNYTTIIVVLAYCMYLLLLSQFPVATVSMISFLGIHVEMDFIRYD